MRRGFFFAGFGAVSAAAGEREERPVHSIGPEDAAIKLGYADSVVFVPGYGWEMRRRTVTTEQRVWSAMESAIAGVNQ